MDKILVEALKKLSNRINLSTGLLHPSDGTLRSCHPVDHLSHIGELEKYLKHQFNFMNTFFNSD